MADPRIPDSSIPSAVSSPASSLVDQAPNATYHIVERVKGDQQVRASCSLASAELELTLLRHCPQVELCRVGGDGARGRECVQIAEDVTKVRC